ncbi:MAG: hypothetical protein IKR97_01825 [Eubacterium sp.]|nr:hypothetical protein [Eubacterium sp.]
MEEKKISFDDLETSDWDIFQEATLDGKPFTGVAVDDYNGVHSEYHYVNGNGHGRCFSVFDNGQLQEEIILNHGETLSERTWTKEGLLIELYDKEPLLRQEFNEKGILLTEEKDEYLHIFRNNGKMLAEYDFKSNRGVYYDWEEVWTVKFVIKDRRFILSREYMTFNEERWEQCYRDILCNDYRELLPLFLKWLEDENMPYEKRSKIICSMISDEELHIKYEGICLARDYSVKEAIPLIDSEKNNRKTPTPFQDMSYGYSVGYLAKTVLKDMKQHNLF